MKKNLKNPWDRQKKSRETEKETKGSIKLSTSYTKKTEKKTIMETLSMLEEKLESFSIHNHINIT